MLNIVWWYATKNKRLVDKKTEPKTIKQIRIRLMVATAVFIPAIALSFVNPLISIVIYVFVSLSGIIVNMIWGGKDIKRTTPKLQSRV
jgi:hypothetical protein